MFVRIAIHGELHEVRADAAMVEQRIALTRRPVAGDSHAGPLAADEELDEVVTCSRHLTCKPVMALDGVEPSGGFVRQHTRDGGGDLDAGRSRR